MLIHRHARPSYFLSTLNLFTSKYMAVPDSNIPPKFMKKPNTLALRLLPKVTILIFCSLVTQGFHYADSQSCNSFYICSRHTLVPPPTLAGAMGDGWWVWAWQVSRLCPSGTGWDAGGGRCDGAHDCAEPCPQGAYRPSSATCGGFEQCAPSGWAFKRCPKGTLWSQSLLTCDHAYNVKCQRP